MKHEHMHCLKDLQVTINNFILVTKFVLQDFLKNSQNQKETPNPSFMQIFGASALPQMLIAMS